MCLPIILHPYCRQTVLSPAEIQIQGQIISYRSFRPVCTFPFQSHEEKSFPLCALTNRDDTSADVQLFFPLVCLYELFAWDGNWHLADHPPFLLLDGMSIFLSSENFLSKM